MKKSLFLALFLWVSNVLGYEIIIDETINTARFQRDDAKQVVVDAKKHLMWQDDESVKNTKRDWNGAMEYCKSLNFAGFSDWRLPTRMELHSITDKKKYNPAIKDKFANITAGLCWSISSFVLASNNAWLLDFNSGNGDWNSKSSSYLVRCVRDSY